MATAVCNIGKYTIVGHLGRGGYASVYKAWCPEQDRKLYFAIKVCERLPDEEVAQGVQDNLLMKEWSAYRALNYGRSDANRNGIPKVHETGDCSLSVALGCWLAGWLWLVLLPSVCSPLQGWSSSSRAPIHTW
jgi:hypothetical protein